MKEQRLSKSGREIRFMGKLICKETTRKDDGPDSSRWWRAELYETEQGFYRAGVAHITLWEDTERDEFFIHDHKDKNKLIMLIEQHNPELAQKVQQAWNEYESVGSRMEP